LVTNLLFSYPYRLGVSHAYLTQVFTIHIYTTQQIIDKAEDGGEKVQFDPGHHGYLLWSSHETC